jgi:hypothetical protein
MTTNDSPQNPMPETWIHGRPLPEEHCGKCFSCGFLRLATPMCNGMDYREVGWIARWGMDKIYDRIETDKEHSVQPMPICIVGFADLHNEIGQQAHEEKGDFERAAYLVFWKDRKCPKWQPYNPGKSKEQYYAEDFVYRLEELRKLLQKEGEERLRAFDERMEKERREFNEQLEVNRHKSETALALRLETDRREWIEKRDEARKIAERKNKVLTIGLAVAGLILATLQVLGMTNDSLLVRLWHFLFG